MGRRLGQGGISVGADRVKVRDLQVLKILD